MTTLTPDRQKLGLPPVYAPFWGSELQRSMSASMRHIATKLHEFSWLLMHQPLSDTERFALRLASAHLRDGRPDLAQEDLLWLGRRLEVEDVDHHGPLARFVGVLTAGA